MANEFRITDVVDAKAIQSLKELNQHLLTAKETYVSVAKEIGGGIKVPVGNFDELSGKAKAYEDAMKRLAEAQRSIADLQQKYNTLLVDVNKKVREAVVVEKQRRAAKQSYVLTLQEALKLAQQEVHSVNEANAANKLLRATVRTLRNDVAEEADAMRVLNEAIDRNSNVITENSDAYTRQKRNVGNYASAWNGLDASMQQILRELPSATMGLNTFFLAISNNLPLLIDQLKMATAQVKAMKEAGEQPIPVWKQLLKSIFSWQSLMMVGITVLSMYGKEIFNWVGNLFKGKDAVDAMKQAEQALHDARVKGLKDSVKERTELGLLYDATQDTTRSMEERNAAADELQRKYPDYFANMSNEEILVGNAKGAYESLSAAIIANAQARAAQDKIQEIAAQRLEKEIKLKEQQKKMEEFDAISQGGTATTSYVQAQGTAGNGVLVTTLTKEAFAYRNAKEAAQGYIDEMNELDAQMKEIAKGIKMTDLLGDVAGGATGGKEIAKKWVSSLTGDFIVYMHDEDTINKMASEYVKRVEVQVNESLGNTEEHYAWMAVRMNEYLKMEIDALAEQYKKGEIDKETYEKKKTEITEEYALKQAKIAIEMLEMQVLTANLSEEEELKLREKISAAKIKLAEMERDATVKAIDKENEARKEQVATMKDMLNEMEGVAEEVVPGLGKIFDGINNIFEKLITKQKVSVGDVLASVASIAEGVGEVLGDIYSKRIEQLEKEEEANEEQGEKEIERIEKLAETGAISEEEAEARKRAAEDKTAAKNAEIAKKKAELQTKQAKLEKATNIITTIMNTAVGIMKAFSQGGIFAAPMAAMIAAMGAIQLATIIAQPIPKYAKGTKGHKGGMAIVGDGGKQEAVITNEGIWATPDVPTLVNLPKGAVVLPDLRDITTAKGMHSDLLLLMDRANKKKGDGVTVNVNNDYSRLEKRMDANASELMQIKKLLKRQGRSQERSWIYGRV